MNLTSSDVKDFWAYMSKRYGFDVVKKSDSSMMELIGWALDMMGVQDKDDFLNGYTTTISGKVYVPFKIGGAKNQAGHIGQFVTCVHEAEHVVQWNRNKIKFDLSYLTSDAARTHYEIEAYRANMEMYWYLTGKCPSPSTLANELANYGVGAADIRVAKKSFIISQKVVERGGVITGPSKVAIAWLKKRKGQRAISRRASMIRV